MSSNNECIEKILECLNNEENRLQEERNQLGRDNDAIRREILSFTKTNIERKIKLIVELRELNKKRKEENVLYNYYKNLYIEKERKNGFHIEFVYNSDDGSYVLLKTKQQPELNNKSCNCCDNKNENNPFDKPFNDNIKLTLNEYDRL